MNKFTIFTIILAVSVITVTVDLTARDYVQKGEVKTSVVSVGTSTETVPVVTVSEPVAPVATSTPVVAEPTAPVFAPIEVPLAGGETIPTNVTQEKIGQAGFSGVLTEKHFDGRVFELLDITKNPVSAMSSYEIFQDGANIVSVTEIVMPDEIRALNLYILLQNKTKPYIDLTLNETNAYGERSFYINHAKKLDEAFLIVKIGKRLYAFAYVKLYHPQLKQLISLLAQ
jgi:hypothetical protein